MLSSAYSYHSPTFSVAGNLAAKHSLFSMQVHLPALTTREFPRTVDILKKNLPSVLKSQCFNDDNLSFYKEVQNTNFAHLFEHLLIEELCLEKLSHGAHSADFSGRTSWNWAKSPRGFYSIFLSASQRHSPIFQTAFSKSIFLLETIINSK